MSKLVINTGTTPNDGTGDSLLAGAGKINSNFTEIYSSIGDGTTLGIASFTQLNVSGASTLAGITTVTGVTLFSKQLNVSGVSTLGVTTTTNLTSQQLNVSGVSTFAGITTVTGVTLFSKQLNVSGVSTITTVGGTNATYTTGNFTTGNIVTGVVTTISGTNATYTTGNFTTGNIVTGVVTNISGTNLNYTGIATVGSVNIGATQVISSGRQLQNIASLDATTTATIESAVSAAPNDFTSLNISGLSTFAGITTVTGVSLFTRQLSVSGVSTFAGITTVTGETLFTRQLSVSGVSTLGITTVTQLASSGIVTASSFRPTTGYYQSANGTNSFFVYDTTGNVAFQGTIGASQLNSAGGNKVIGLAGTDATFENNIRVTGVSTLGITTFNNVVGFGSSAFFGDNDSLYLGDGNDLRIFHNGSNSFIQDLGTGNLFIDASSTYYRATSHLIQNASSSETFATFTENSSVALYYDNVKTFETSGIGVTVSGTLVATQLNVSGVATITGNLNAAGNYYVKLARLTNQTVTSGADALIGFSAVSDPNSWYSGITTRTTPTVAGTYHVDVMLNWNAGTISTDQSNIQIRKNGVTFALSQVGIRTFAYTQNACGIVTMNGTTDYIDFTVYTANPTSHVVTGTADGAWTKMEIFKIN
jgi:hypothetical protein